MFFKQFLTEDLQAFSYLIGDGGQAVVVDPNYEAKPYLETASKEGLEIIAILETHRHEDQVSGAKKLAELSGGTAYHSAYEDLGYSFGEELAESRTFQLSESVTVKPLHTPGHTLGHLCYVVEVDSVPYMILTGDTLFYGGVGRTDFYGKDNLTKMTKLLHESLYQKIFPLGDHVLVMPGHAAGSACGDEMDHLPSSTLGFERKHSSVLSEDYASFEKRNANMQYKNPAFSVMEVKNVQGDGALFCPPALVKAEPGQAQVADLRPLSAYATGHLPGSLHIPAGRVAAYLGWYCDPTKPVCFVIDDVPPHLVDQSVKLLPCIGFQTPSVLADGTVSDYVYSGKELESLSLISPRDYLSLPESDDYLTLDVRRREEFSEANDPLTNRLDIPYQELRDRLAEVPKDKKIYITCAGGERAAVAASWLLQQGYSDICLLDGGTIGLRAANQ